MKILALAASLAFLLVATSLAQNSFLYTNDDQSPNTVSAFRVAQKGSLTLLGGSPFRTGGKGGSSNLDPEKITIATVGSATGVSKTFLYAGNSGSGSVSGFVINIATGQLTTVPGSPFLSGGNSSADFSLAANPGGQFLFVADGITPDVHVFQINGGNGSLTEIQGSPFASGASVEGLKATANGRFLIASSYQANWVEVFSVASSGSLSLVGTVPATAAPEAVEVNCAGTVVFAADTQAARIDVYYLSPNGTLSPLVGSPFSNGTDSNTMDVKMSPNNQYLFSTDGFGNGVSTFSVAANGSLTPVAGSPFLVRNRNSSLAISQKGEFLYDALSTEGSVDGRSVSSNGELTPVPGTPFGTRQSQAGNLAAVAFPPAPCSVAAPQGIRRLRRR
jgi:6-phosphogluconolactonase (cycloisomerase 2 family)